MAGREADFAVLMEHVRRVKGDPACVFCGRNDWAFGGVVAALLGTVAERRFVRDPNGDVISTAALVCNGCGYVMHFAWGVVIGDKTH